MACVDAMMQMTCILLCVAFNLGIYLIEDVFPLDTGEHRKLMRVFNLYFGTKIKSTATMSNLHAKGCDVLIAIKANML